MQVKVGQASTPLRKRKHVEVVPLPLGRITKKTKAEGETASEPTTPTSCKGRRASSIYRGVCWLKERKAWRARIEIAGKREHLGYFTSEKEAAMAYDRRARTVARKKSRLNFPELDSLETQSSRIDTGSVHTPASEEAAKKLTCENTTAADAKIADAKASLLSLGGFTPSCGQLNTLGLMSPFGSVLNLQQQINFMQLQYNLVNSLNAQSGVSEFGKVKTGLQQVCSGPSPFAYPVKTPPVACNNVQVLNPAMFSLV